MSEMTATRKAATLVLFAAIWIAAAALLWRTDVPSAAAEYEDGLPPVAPQIAEAAEDYSRVARLLVLGGLVGQLAAIAALVVATRRGLPRLRGPALARSLELLTLALAAAWLGRLPFRIALHWWRRRHGLSSQPYLDSLLAPWLDRLALMAAAAFALVVATLLARRLGERWWVAGAPALTLVGTAVLLVQPLVLAPRLEPLRNPRLAAEVRALAREQGIDHVDVVERHVSDRTRTVNAEVAGLGPTLRVVLWDTLRNRVDERQLRFLVAHELAHVSRSHLLEGIAWFALLTPLLTYAVARATRRRGGIAEPRAVPVAVLTVVALQLALLPAANAISRRYEREADWVALETTGDPNAAIGLFRRFADENLTDPTPPRWATVVFGTHPTLEDRIDTARFFEQQPR
jgi:STE24 endopeptidase